jgi:circadian clock protein KaiB
VSDILSGFCYDVITEKCGNIFNLLLLIDTRENNASWYSSKRENDNTDSLSAVQRSTMLPENDAKYQLEQALIKRQSQKYSLRLYVTDSKPNSKRAIENLRQLCESHLKDRYTLEIIDIQEYPQKAKSDHIIVTPVLVKDLPTPLIKFIGDLSDTEKILVSLDVKATNS